MTEQPYAGATDEPGGSDDVEPVGSDDIEPAADDSDADQPAETATGADPRIEAAVRRLNELADLPPADHVEVYEAVHSSLQESLAAASRQADESPADGNPPS